MAPIAARVGQLLSRGGAPSLPHQAGKIGYILLWLLGVPLPILFIIYLLRGCT